MREGFRRVGEQCPDAAEEYQCSGGGTRREEGDEDRCRGRTDAEMGDPL